MYYFHQPHLFFLFHLKEESKPRVQFVMEARGQWAGESIHTLYIRLTLCWLALKIWRSRNPAKNKWKGPKSFSYRVEACYFPGHSNRQ